MEANDTDSGCEKYSKLHGERSFRLIKNIHISKADSVLSCDLDVYNLESCPPYQALSYTWGSPLIVEEASLVAAPVTVYELCIKQSEDSFVIPITENLSHALNEYFNTRSNFYHIPYLWVDAICINQEDLAEKSAQVSMMSSIYSQASRVIVWLGKDSNDVEDFNAIFADMGGFPGGDKDDYDAELMGRRYKWAMENVAADVIDTSDPKWEVYRKFYATRRWFHRAWIVQETALARNIYVCCGRTPLSWGAMGLFSWGLAYGHKEAKPLMHQMRIHGRPPGDEMLKLFHLKDMCIRAKEAPDNPQGLTRWLADSFGALSREEQALAFFQHILEMIRPFEATNPRDKIYAALGIANQIFATDLSRLIQPNYGTPVEEVYRAATVLLYAKLPWMTVLYMAGSGSKQHDLPSWVPDYTIEQANTPLLSLSGKITYKASAGLGANTLPRTVVGKVLKLHGARFDRIGRIAAHVPGGSGGSTIYSSADATKRIEFASEILEMCCHSVSPHQSKIDRFASLAIAMTGGQDVPENAALCLSSWILQTFATSTLCADTSTLSLAFSMLEKVSDLVNTGEFTLPPLIPSLDYFMEVVIPAGTKELTAEDQQVINQVDQYATLFSRWTIPVAYGRKLCLTGAKRLGFGSSLMQAGDEVWLLVDARTPLILRPRAGGDAYALIGEIYLHDCMHGEIVDAKLKSEVTLVNII